MITKRGTPVLHDTVRTDNRFVISFGRHED